MSRLGIWNRFGGEQRVVGRSARTLVASAVAMALAGHAVAQQVPTTGAGTAPDASQLTEITVTASKRAEPLSKAPLAVTALTQDELTTAGVVQLQDMTTAVPNVEMRTVATVSSVQVTIRGITNTDFNAGGSPAVATYVDGVYLARTQGLNGDLYDLARVEVLRGPQGTLYGRNATGGNINVLTADPINAFDAAVDFTYGNFNEVHTRGMINLPITDELAVRGAFSVRRNDGYEKTDDTTERNYGAADDYSGRLTALWTPSDAFKWRLALEDSVQNGTPGLEYITGPNGRPLGGTPVFDGPVASPPDPTKYIRNFMIRSKMDAQLGSHFTLTYLAGYADLLYTSEWAFGGTGFAPDGTILNLGDGHRTGGSKSYSHELDLAFDFQNLHNILGATYQHESESDFDAYQFPTIGILYRGGTSLGPTATDEAWGIFDQAVYTVVDGLRLTGGVRYSHESKANALNGFGQAYCPLTTPLNVGLSQTLAPGCSFSPEAPVQGSWSNTNWKGGIDYDLTAEILAYATVTTGFKAGGLNIGGNITPESYAPEKVTSYEAGIKGHFLDNRVRLYANGFYMDYKDLQVTQLSGVAVVTDNAAKAKIYGTELEGEWLITRDDHFDGFFTYLHATYADYPNAVDQFTNIVYPNLAGNTLTDAPRYSARVAYAHDFAMPNGGSLTPKAAVYYQSHLYLREFNLPIDAVNSYTETNLNLGYLDPTRHWNVDAFIENLENRVVRNGGSTAVGLYISDYNMPRTYGVRIGYKY